MTIDKASHLPWKSCLIQLCFGASVVFVIYFQSERLNGQVAEASAALQEMQTAISQGTETLQQLRRIIPNLTSVVDGMCSNLALNINCS